jgi:hypothetical protein
MQKKKCQKSNKVYENSHFKRELSNMDRGDKQDHSRALGVLFVYLQVVL